MAKKVSIGAALANMNMNMAVGSNKAGHGNMNSNGKNDLRIQVEDESHDSHDSRDAHGLRSQDKEVYQYASHAYVNDEMKIEDIVLPVDEKEDNDLDMNQDPEIEITFHGDLDVEQRHSEYNHDHEGDIGMEMGQMSRGQTMENTESNLDTIN